MNDFEHIYYDIINLPHPEPSPWHPRMPRKERAAQFAPCAALTGYEDIIAATAEQSARTRQK